MKKVGIIDYGVGNVRSIANALKHLGANPVLSADRERLLDCGSLILPGVGAFGYGMKALRERGLDRVVLASAETGKPLLGICLGMQLLYASSSENGLHHGLSILSGGISLLQGNSTPGEDRRLPNIDWLPVHFGGGKNGTSGGLLDGIGEGENFYFLHSCHAQSNHPCTIATASFANSQFAAMVVAGSVVGTQFHPEKSGPAGLRLLNNFLNWRPAA